MDYQKIKLEVKDNLAISTLNQPEVLNAISFEMLGELNTAVAKVENADMGIRCLLIKAEGRAFCASSHLTKQDCLELKDYDPGVPFSLDDSYNPLF